MIMMTMMMVAMMMMAAMFNIMRVKMVSGSNVL